MLTQHNRKTCRLSPDYTFAIRELGVWSGDETTAHVVNRIAVTMISFLNRWKRGRCGTSY